MHRSLICVAALATLVHAQESFTAAGAIVKTESRGGATVSFVSRDGGRTWTEQGAVDAQLHLHYGSFDPRNPPQVPSDLQAGPENRLFVVQFHTGIIAEFRAALRGLDVEICRYLPGQCYLVRMAAARRDAVAALACVRSVSAFHPAYRLHPEVLADLAQSSGTKRYAVVFVDKRRDTQGLEAAIEAAGGRLHIASAGGILCEADLTKAQLLAIAQDDRTLWLEYSTAPEVDVDIARIQGGSNYVETMAGIAGIGMVGHIMEGVHATHTEFAEIAGVRLGPIGVRDTASSSHGTNTAGEIYARGASSLYRGLMPNARMTYTNYNYVYSGSTRYALTAELKRDYMVMLQTASWGYARTLIYDARSAEMDDILFDHDIYITQSQSNAGATTEPRASRPQAWAKNITAVGGFLHRNNTSPTDDTWGRSGSTGPANDGRIGVTLSAYYDSIGTTSGSTAYTTGFGGTSGATPLINGLGGNAIEMFTDGLFGYGKAATKTPADRVKVLPHFTTTRSLLIATATQLTWDATGVSVGANRYQQGWGFPSLTRLYDERNRLLVIDELDVLQQEQSRTYYVFATGGRFVASMNHADPEAAANATIHRINSVDLEVKTADGNRWLGNNGLTSGPVSTAGGLPNDRDTVETVILANAPRGLAEVTVRATGVRQDGHVQTPAFDVDYALVVQGIGGNRDRSAMNLELESAAPGDLRVRLQGLPSGWTVGYTLFARATTRPLSTGNLLGLEADALTSALVQQPPAAGNVFAFVPTGSPTTWPNAAFAFPVPLALTVSGVTFDAVAIVLDGAGKLVGASNVARLTVK